MKKIIIAISLFVLVALLRAEDIKIFSTNTYMKIPEYIYKEFDKSSFIKSYRGLDKTQYERGIEFPFFIETDDLIYLYNRCNYIKLNRNTVKINEEGFQYFKYKGNIQYIFSGGNYYTVKYSNFFKEEDPRINEIGETFHKVFTSENYNCENGDLVSTDKKLEGDWNSWCSGYLDYSLYIQNIIKSVKMNVPYLREKINGNEILYDDDMLKFRWFNLFSRSGTVYANCTKPMVEGDSGNGVGVQIDVDFHIPSDNIVILNGYVDWNKQHLYKKNARMKKVLVEGEDFSLEYTFEDYVHFAQIDFPEKTGSVKITVLEVYDGSKWADMAISGMWVNPDVTHTANSPLAKEYLKYAEENCIEITE